MNVALFSLASTLKRAVVTNKTTANFAALLDTLTKPERGSGSTERAIYKVDQDGTRNRNTLVVVPFGGDTNNDIIKVKVKGWSFIPPPSTGKGAWHPTLICEVSCTLSSTLVGLANESVVATEFYADTLSLTNGVATLFQGTADVDPAYFQVGISGFEMVEVEFAMGTGGDQANALVRLDT